MLSYDIKHDGWPLGTARGKKKAVERLKHYMGWEGVTDGKWTNKAGVITVTTKMGIFTIEELH